MFQLIYKLMGLVPSEKGAPGGPEAPVAASVAAASDDPPKLKRAADAGENALSRVDLLQMMWGTGFGFPGNASYIKELVSPMALDSQKSVVDLTAGLGGAARAIAGAFKTYVTGMERDVELAHAGNKISATTGFGKTAPITHYDPQKINYDKKADAVIARGLLYTCEDKDAMLVRMAALLKPHGHLLLNDFVCAAEDRENADVKAWAAAEPYGAHLVPVEEIERAMKKHGFDVRVKEDVSAPYAKTILKGLARMAQQLQKKELGPGAKALIRKETDMWIQRVAALNGKVRYVRFYAIKAR